MIMKKFILSLVLAATALFAPKAMASDNNKKEKAMKTIELTKADFLAKVAD